MIVKTELNQKESRKLLTRANECFILIKTEHLFLDEKENTYQWKEKKN